jgi:hypothetical protein
MGKSDPQKKEKLKRYCFEVLEEVIEGWRLYAYSFEVLHSLVKFTIFGSSNHWLDADPDPQ